MSIPIPVYDPILDNDPIEINDPILDYDPIEVNDPIEINDPIFDYDPIEVNDPNRPKIDPTMLFRSITVMTAKCKIGNGCRIMFR